MGDLITKIYDKNFNLIYTAKDDYAVSSNGELVISDQNKFYVFDNYKVKYESKEYERIYLNVKDYISVSNNGYLILVNNW